MFNLTPIQTFLAITNFIELACLPVLFYVVLDYRQRVRGKYERIEKQLDHILLLSSELYQTEIKDKTVAPSKNPTTLSRALSTKKTG